MLIGKYVEPTPVININTNIQAVIKLMVETRHHIVLVKDNDTLVGVLEQATLTFPMLKGELEWDEIINRDVLLVSDDLLIQEAARLSVSWFIVLGEKHKVLGIVSKNLVIERAFDLIYEQNIYVNGIMDQAYNGIISVKKEREIRVANQAAKKLLYYDQGSYEEILRQLDAVADSGVANIGHKITIEVGKGKKSFLTNQTPIISHGKVVGAVAILHDLMEMESISKELSSVKQLYNQLETTIQASFDGVLVTNATGVVLKANKAIEKLLSLSKDELIGEKIGTEALERKIPKVLISSVQETGDRVSVVSEFHDRQLLLTANPVNNGENLLTSIVINVRDLTELNCLKQALNKSQLLSERYHSELSELRNKLLKQQNIVVNSKVMQGVFDIASRVAKVVSTVLILGESGVGKEIVAKYIHTNSNRKKEAFITVNCGAIPENLLETEFFGYESGAFTGASKNGKAGLFEVAHKGTLFLDEIGELPLQLQVKLLRAIQDRTTTRVGGSKPRNVDVRIIAATNRDLNMMVQKKEFRQDLYFRLNVVPLKVPSLRERKEEIPHLCRHFVKNICKRFGLNKTLSPEVISLFLKYDWPGNIRELENVIERIIVTSTEEEITGDSVPDFLFENRSNANIQVKGIMPLKRATLEVEKQIIEKAVDRYGSIRKAADVLGVNQSTIVRKMQRIKEELNYKIDKSEISMEEMYEKDIL